MLEIVYKDIEENKEYEEVIKKVIEQCYKEENLENSKLFITITLTNPENIQKINKEYRNIDKPTDVLSFPNLNFVDKKIDTKTLSEELDQDTGLVSLGDIVICKEIAKRQAKEYGHSYKREICFLALHGLLHLIGYDHEIKEQEEEMMAKAESILKEHKVIR